MFGSRCWIRPMQRLPQLVFSSLAPGYQSPRTQQKFFDPDNGAARVTCISSMKAEGPGQVSSGEGLSIRVVVIGKIYDEVTAVCIMGTGWAQVMKDKVRPRARRIQEAFAPMKTPLLSQARGCLHTQEIHMC